MSKLSRLLPLLLLLALPSRSSAQAVIVGQPCGAGGLSAIATNGTPVVCTGNPLVWTSPTGSGGGISSVSSLPATCTPGVTANVNLTSGPTTVQQEYQCGPLGNTWFPFNPSLVVSPLSYGAKWDVKPVTNCTFTNLSNIVTCPAGEAQWTSADLGKIYSGRTGPAALTTGCSGATCGSEVIPQGFICSIISADSITVGTTYPGCAADNATANCTPTVGIYCTSLWGTQDDSAAINLAAAAAWTGNSCKALYFPSGMAFFTIPPGGLLNVTLPVGSPCAGSQIADATQTGALVYGTGAGNSVLVPLSTTNFINCNGGLSTTACISGPPNWFAHDWGVWGFGLSGSGTTHANNLIEFNGVNPSCTAAAAWNMSFSEWQTASINSQGFVIRTGCGVLYASNIVSEGFGNVPCVISVVSNLTTVNALDCFGSSGGAAAASAIFTGNSQINSTGSMYWGVNPTNSAAALELAGSGGLVVNSFSDLIAGATNGNNNFGVFFNNGGTATLNLSGTNVQENNTVGAGNSSLFFCGSSAVTCNVSAYGANLVATGAKMQMFNHGTGALNFFDACANTYTQGGVANASLNIFGLCSQTATTSATTNFGTALAAQTVVNTMSPTGPLTLNLTVEQITLGVGCSVASNTVTPTLSYTAPGGNVQTPALTALTISGNGAVDTFQNDTLTITTKPGTNITYTTASALASTGCTTTPQYIVYAKAVQ